MSSSSIQLAQVASKITTIGQVRAAMGAVTLTLSQGYAALDNVTSVAGVQDAARSLLDIVNSSATQLYNIYNDDPDLQDEEISTWHAIIAGRIVSEANDALKSVEEATGVHFDVATLVSQGLANVGTAVGTGIQSVTNAVAAGATAFAFAAWPTILVVGGVVAIYFFRKPILRVIGGAAQ